MNLLDMIRELQTEKEYLDRAGRILIADGAGGHPPQVKTRTKICVRQPVLEFRRFSRDCRIGRPAERTLNERWDVCPLG